MKIVFNFNCGRILALLAALVAFGSAPARAEGVYFSTADLLRDFFRDSKAVTYKKVEIAPKDRDRLMRRLGYAPAKQTYTFYVATSGTKVDGYALIDEENGEHLPITFAVKISPEGVVLRQEIVCYRESRGDEVRATQFRQQFVGKSARDPVMANQDIVAVSGATISSRAMAVGVKRALVLFDELVRGQVMTAAASVSPSHGL
jgi:electron transport complex protein RnfG